MKSIRWGSGVDNEFVLKRQAFPQGKENDVFYCQNRSITEFIRVRAQTIYPKHERARVRLGYIALHCTALYTSVRALFDEV